MSPKVYIFLFRPNCDLLFVISQDLLADIHKEMKKQNKKQSSKEETDSNPPAKSAPPVTTEKPKGGRRLVITEIEGSDESEDDEWSDAKQEQTTPKNAKNADQQQQNGKLVNGNVESPSNKKGGKGAASESGKVKGRVHGDEVDGGCASRMTDGKKTKSQNGKSKKSQVLDEKKQAPKNLDVSEQNAAVVTKDDTPIQPPKETVQPPKPKVERSLPPVMVALKDAALTLYKSGQYGEARDKFTQAIERITPGKLYYADYFRRGVGIL